jgi:hypothetical protein
LVSFLGCIDDQSNIVVGCIDNESKVIVYVWLLVVLMIVDVVVMPGGRRSQDPTRQVGNQVWCGVVCRARGGW